MSARLSEHARQRCAEMGIGTKAVKRLADGRERGVDFPAQGGRVHRRGPDFTLVLDHDEDGGRWVITVLYNHDFDRRQRAALPTRRRPGGGNVVPATTLERRTPP